MKQLRRLAALGAAATALWCAAGLAQAQTYIAGSVAGQLAPGVYGRVDIGGPPPPLMYAQPVLIAPPAVRPPPVYMYVPPGHAKNWRKHCGRYHACGQPVYFLRDAPRGWHAERRHQHREWEREQRRHERWEARRDREHERWERRRDRDHDRRHRHDD